MRPYYNLPSKSDYGRKMTGFITPYRHWMWKQNELWRNVHEAQFEHLRKVYKRQWLESFRVNADEYIYKYNITKAAQLAQWEYEMQAQEAKRRESQQMAQGRQALKKKHLDLLREFHERQFFYWYERASERLQYMAHIDYIPQSKIQAHIERELDKYVAGSRAPYPLNFAGQMPMLEDRDGNVVQVPATLMTNHAAENVSTTATEYVAPEGTMLAEERLLQMMAGSQEEELRLHSDDSQALSATIDDIDRQAEEMEDDVKVARSVEETDAEREIARRAYIDRGKTGSRDVFRRPRFEDEQPGGVPSPGSTPVKRRKSRLDKAHQLQEQQDSFLAQMTAKSLKGGQDLNTMPKRGEVGKSTGRIRDRVVAPTLEEIQNIPELRSTSVLGARPHTKDMVDKRFGRGKYRHEDKDKNDGGEDV